MQELSPIGPKTQFEDLASDAPYVSKQHIADIEALAVQLRAIRVRRAEIQQQRESVRQQWEYYNVGDDQGHTDPGA